MIARFRECASLLESHQDKSLSKYLETLNSFIAQLEEHEEQEAMDTGDTVQTPLPPAASETTSQRKMRFQEVH